ncbi:MAG: hypothetical protein AAF355_02895 [Myxococcota bacterium]
MQKFRRGKPSALSAFYRLRIGVPVVCAAGLLLGPAPGDVGGCGSGGGLADPEVFCIQFEEASCMRDRISGELTEDEEVSCLLAVPAECESAVWPSGCAPSPRAADRCIDAVSDVKQLSTPTGEIEECQLTVLCSR